MKKFLLVLCLTLLLPLSGTALATHLLPEKAKLGEVRLLNLREPKVQNVMLLVMALYQNRISPNWKPEYPETLRVYELTGKAGQDFQNSCNCLGIVEFEVPDVILMVSDSKIRGPEYILAHELTHILQLAEGRDKFYPLHLLEQEAEFIAVETMIIYGAK